MMDSDVMFERERNWCLFYSFNSYGSIQLVAGHANYTIYGLCNIKYFRFFAQLKSGKVLKRRAYYSSHLEILNGIFCDVYIETTLMRYGHGKQCIISIAQKPENLITLYSHL